MVFDLDDTLYRELDFVESGYRSVAAFLAHRHGFSELSVRRKLMKRLRAGRDGVFDDVLGELGVYTRKEVQACLTNYRTHTPRLALPIHARRCLQRFCRGPRYVVTDGNHRVQRSKFKALRLERFIDRAYFTSSYGWRHSKPSPHCFELIRKRERCDPGRIVYVGDNPRKDFVGIKPLGYRTVQVLQGPHRVLKMPASHRAHVTIDGIADLSRELVEDLIR